jgi:phosphoserine aminotransferase
MTERVFNFSAGPATLPQPVLEEAQRDLVALPGLGISPLEVSHRAPWFTDVIDEAEANLRALLDIPDSHAVIFPQGGATQQFSMAALNLLRGTGGVAEYVITGSWGAKALVEAAKEGVARAAWSGKDEGFVRAPADDELADALSTGAAYVHITSNETIQGVEFHGEPTVPADAPLLADMSSDFLSRPVNVGAYGLIYAGAQKNAGPAGVTVAIVERALLERVPEGLPTILDYRTYVEHGSRYNTPPVFSIYILMLVTRWLRDEVGGLEAQRAANRAKAAALYETIDGSEGFYRGHAHAASRSLMNVTWRLPTEDLERAFVHDAAEAGMVELKGHRSVGGIRASLYNAMPLAGARALADFMHSFAVAHA